MYTAIPFVHKIDEIVAYITKKVCVLQASFNARYHSRVGRVSGL